MPGLLGAKAEEPRDDEGLSTGLLVLSLLMLSTSGPCRVWRRRSRDQRRRMRTWCGQRRRRHMPVARLTGCLSDGWCSANPLPAATTCPRSIWGRRSRRCSALGGFQTVTALERECLVSERVRRRRIPVSGSSNTVACGPSGLRRGVALGRSTLVWIDAPGTFLAVWRNGKEGGVSGCWRCGSNRALGWNLFVPR